MPKRAERKARRRGGVVRYRMMRKGGKLFRCMITRKKGPRGGRTICYKVTTRKRKKKTKKTKEMKVVWQDAYTSTKTELDRVLRELGTVALTTSYGKKVYQNKEFIVFCQEQITNVKDGNNYLIIPKSLIIRRNRCPDKRRRSSPRRRSLARTSS